MTNTVQSVEDAARRTTDVLVPLACHSGPLFRGLDAEEKTHEVPRLDCIGHIGGDCVSCRWGTEFVVEKRKRRLTHGYTRNRD